MSLSMRIPLSALPAIDDRSAVTPIGPPGPCHEGSENCPDGEGEQGAENGEGHGCDRCPEGVGQERTVGAGMEGRRPELEEGIPAVGVYPPGHGTGAAEA